MKSPAALPRAADHFGVARRYGEVADPLAGEQLDGAVVASPHVAHFDNALPLVAAGIRALVEKPMTAAAVRAPPVKVPNLYHLFGDSLSHRNLADPAALADNLRDFRRAAEFCRLADFFLDAPAGIAQGREVHGQPKKFARPKLRRKNDVWLGQVRRDGIEVVTATMAYKQRRGDLADLKARFDFSVNLNLKAVDHMDGRPAIRQLTSRKLAAVAVHECWRGPCAVELRPHIQAPAWRLPVAEALEGFYWRADFTLVAGDIVHDYLAAAPPSTQRRARRGKGATS